MKLINSNKLYIMTILVTILGFSLSAFSKGGVGTGGGDIIRSMFLETGKRVLTELDERNLEPAMKESTDLRIDDLKRVLTIQKIIVTPNKLYDQTGSLVDSVMYDPNTLQLNDEKWEQHIRDQRDLRKQVFHEMLRLSGFNDDNYVFSGEVYSEKMLNSNAPVIQDSKSSSSNSSCHGRTAPPLTDEKVVILKKPNKSYRLFVAYTNERESVVQFKNNSGYSEFSAVMQNARLVWFQSQWESACYVSCVYGGYGAGTSTNSGKRCQRFFFN